MFFAFVVWMFCGCACVLCTIVQVCASVTLFLCDCFCAFGDVSTQVRLDGGLCACAYVCVNVRSLFYVRRLCCCNIRVMFCVLGSVWVAS